MGRFLASLLAAFIFRGVLAGAGLYASIRIWPQIGAQAADGLRQLVGDKAVARLETLALDALDFLHVEQYKVTGMQQTEPPWTLQPAPPS